MNMKGYQTLDCDTHITVREQPFYCCSTFHRHSRIFNNEQNSYHKMSVNLPLVFSLQTWFSSALKPNSRFCHCDSFFIVYSILPIADFHFFVVLVKSGLSLAVCFISIDQYYIWESLSFWCYLVVNRILFPRCRIINKRGQGVWCLTPLSTIFQLYRCRKLEYLEKTTNMSKSLTNFKKKSHTVISSTSRHGNKKTKHE